MNVWGHYKLQHQRNRESEADQRIYTAPIPSFLHGLWWSELRSSCLQSKLFISWTISPALNCRILKLKKNVLVSGIVRYWNILCFNFSFYYKTLGKQLFLFIFFLVLFLFFLFLPSSFLPFFWFLRQGFYVKTVFALEKKNISMHLTKCTGMTSGSSKCINSLLSCLCFGW